jgi:hypothetical protein
LGGYARGVVFAGMPLVVSLVLVLPVLGLGFLGIDATDLWRSRRSYPSSYGVPWD